MPCNGLTLPVLNTLSAALSPESRTSKRACGLLVPIPTLPLTSTFPFTLNLEPGVLVPMPTLPSS